MGTYRRSGTPFLYDDVSNDIAGLVDPDGSEATLLLSKNGALDAAGKAALNASGYGSINRDLSRMFESAQAQIATNGGGWLP